MNYLIFYRIEGIVSDSEFSKIDLNKGSNQSNSKFSRQNIFSKTASEGVDIKSSRSIFKYLKYNLKHQLYSIIL